MSGHQGAPGGTGAELPVIPGFPVERAEKATQMRRIIANRMRTGLATSAQLTLTAEADLTALGAELKRLTQEWGRRASYTEAAVRASAIALRAHPRVTAILVEGQLLYPSQIDIGVAVALDEGLVAPIIRNADRKGLAALNAEIAELAEKARGGRLTLDELQGGCFTVTNLGGYRIDAFTPVLNPPQSAILGMGRGRLRPAVADGAIVPRNLAVLSLTIDHQVIDGAPGAAFLGDVLGLLEDPARLLVEP
jgi:pyruvate dehydrogenase E2 component (dihydrolipoamide acetyltransferase)